LSTNLLINRPPQQRTLPAKKLAILTSALARLIATSNPQISDLPLAAKLVIFQKHQKDGVNNPRPIEQLH
jgi:hypothetical protein